MRRAGLIALGVMLSCNPRTRVVEQFPSRETERFALPSPSHDAVARFVVISRGVRYERVHDGFGCTSGELPSVGVIPALQGAQWEAHLRLRVDGRAGFSDDPEGLSVQLVRGGGTRMNSRDDAEIAARDGAVQACWSPDGTRIAFRTHRPGAMAIMNWTRVEWSPAVRVVRWISGRITCERALSAAPSM